MLSTRWPCCLNGELLLEPQVWVNPKLLMAKLHVCLQISYMSIADSWFLFKITTSVDVGFPWALHGLFQTRSPGRALPGVLHGLPQTWRKRAWIGAGEGPAGRVAGWGDGDPWLSCKMIPENMVVSIYLYLYFNLYIYMYIIDRILLWFKAFQWLWMAPFSVDRIFSGGNIYFTGNMVTAFFSNLDSLTALTTLTGPAMAHP